MPIEITQRHSHGWRGAHWMDAAPRPLCGHPHDPDSRFTQIVGRLAISFGCCPPIKQAAANGETFQLAVDVWSASTTTIESFIVTATRIDVRWHITCGEHPDLAEILAGIFESRDIAPTAIEAANAIRHARLATSTPRTANLVSNTPASPLPIQRPANALVTIGPDQNEYLGNVDAVRRILANTGEAPSVGAVYLAQATNPSISICDHCGSYRSQSRAHRCAF